MIFFNLLELIYLMNFVLFYVINLFLLLVVWLLLSYYEGIFKILFIFG